MELLDGQSVGLLKRLLAASELRAKVLGGNIANQSTPGYVRQVVDFESLLQGELGRPAGDPGGIEPLVRQDLLTPARADGNNVTLEVELTALRENRVLYETYAAILASHFRSLEAAITESR